MSNFSQLKDLVQRKFLTIYYDLIPTTYRGQYRLPVRQKCHLENRIDKAMIRKVDVDPWKKLKVEKMFLNAMEDKRVRRTEKKVCK